MSAFKKLFQPGKIGKLTLANRIAMAPMVTHFAEAGGAGDRMIGYYAERAKGGAGMVILEASYPRRVGHPGRVHIWGDEFIPGLKRLTTEVHRAGGKIAIEINPSRGRVDEADPISASPVPHPVTGKVPRALTVEEIRNLEEEFGRSVARAREAGFDAVMIHAGTGYLLSEFLSPRINLRQDAYGGDVRGRARLSVEMVKEAKKQGGKDYPLIIRVAASERVEGGVSLEDVEEACRLVEKAGVDAIDVVSGVAETPEWVVPSLYFPPGCNVPLAEAIKKRVSIPVMVAGRINDPFQAEEILEKGKADYVVMGRALLADPYFPAKAGEGKANEIRKCIGCLRCIESFSANLPLVCAVNPRVGKEREPGPRRGRAKRVVVVGGGPAGLQAALTAAENGHSVVLLEREKELGGQLHLASIPPGKGEIRNLMTYFSGQLPLHRGKIQVRREEANPSTVRELKPDAVISAVGSVPFIPEIPGIREGIKNKKVVTGREVLSGKKPAGKRTVVIGGGMIGCEIACHLAEKGHEVSLIEILPELAMDAFSHIRKVLVGQISRKGIRVYTGVKEERIKEEGVEIVDSGGKTLFLEADTMILSAGSAPDSALSRSFQGTAPEFYEVGDCREARRILEAVHGGDEAARKL